MEVDNELKVFKNGHMFTCIREYWFNNVPTSETIGKLIKLFNEGANINDKDNNDHENTILHIAARKGEKEMINFLLDKGACICSNKLGKTPIDIALCNNKKDVCIILREWSKKLTAKQEQTTKTEVVEEKTSKNVKPTATKNQKSNQTQNTNVTRTISQQHELNNNQELYEKRAGTSGARGQFYESKLLSLVLHKALHDQRIEDFMLATNISGIGDFDDVCIRIKTTENGEAKHALCFLQAKHKEDPNKDKLSVASLRNPAGSFSLTKYYDSFIKIKQKISQTSKTPMFQGDFNELHCYFVLYTPLKDLFNRKLQNNASICGSLDSLIYTGEVKSKSNDIFQFNYEDTDLEILTKYLQNENLKKIGKVFLDFVMPEKNRPKEIMNSELIKLYHPAIAREVIVIDDEIYEGKFREDFFSKTDETLVELREHLYREFVFQQGIQTELTREELQRKMKKILHDPTALNISQLIGEVLEINKENFKLKIDYNKINLTKFKLEELYKIDQELSNLHVTIDVINEAVRLKGKKKLKALSFNLPVGFGQNDGESIPLQKNDIKDLSKILFIFILSSENFAKAMMNNKFLKMYHAALGENVIEVYKFYKAKFRNVFLDSNDDKLLMTLKESLINEIVLTQSKKTSLSKDTIKQKIKQIVASPCAKTISSLIGEVLTIDNKTNYKLKLDITKISVTQYSQDELRQLNNDIQKIHVSPIIVKTAISIVGKNRLRSLVFKLPQTFGNYDIQTTMQKRDDNTNRLDFFANKFSTLIKRETNSNILQINSDVVGPSKLFEFSHINNIGNIGGAVGNLLRFDYESQMYTFNTNEETLEKNAKYMLQQIKILTKADLSKYKIHVDLPVCHFPRTCFKITDVDKKLAREFLSKLWFYTNQANEEKVEEILKKAIDKHYNSIEKQKNQFLFRVYSDAIFLRFHDEVQKWWKSQGKAPYLSKTTTIFETAKKGIVESPLLTVLNQMFVRNAKNLEIEFNTSNIKPSKITDFLQKSNNTNYKIFNIVSQAIILSAVKLLQYTENIKTNDTTFINLNYVNILPSSDYNTMKEEIETLKSTILVIFSETYIDKQVHQKLTNMLELFKGNVIIISDSTLYVGSKYLHYEYITQNDNEVNLNNLTIKSQTDILNKFKIVYQGEHVNLNVIIDDSSKHIINGKLLWSIINNIKLEIGQPIARAYNYHEIKNNFINRRLYRSGEGIEINTLNDLSDKYAIISSQPCGGKTILLTHLALNTKTDDPQLWIVQVNLASHIQEFSKFQDKKLTNLDIFMFLSKTALKNTGAINDLDFKQEDEKISILNPKDHKNDMLFELKLFIHFYNNGRMIFLFDGFERMYPQNTQNAIYFFKVLRQADKRFWITTSCYCNKILMTEFEALYELPRLDVNEQRSFLDRFWETNLKLENLNHEQFNNIYLFLKFIFKTFNLEIDEGNQDRPIRTLLSVPMQLVYLSAVEHFKNEIENLTPRYLREKIKKKWRLDSYTAVDRYLGRSNDEESLELAGTPMHMYLAASYFEVQIKEKLDLDFKADEFVKKSRYYLDVLTSYERLLKNNIKYICNLEINDHKKLESNQLLRDKFIETHKNLALFALCKESDVAKVLTPSKIKEVKKIIKDIESGEMKTPLIDCVVDGVPRFYNLLFAEYFVVELGTSTLQTIVSNKLDEGFRLESLWDFIVNIVLLISPEGVRNAFEYKLKYDPELLELTNDKRNSKIIFDLLKKQKEENSETGTSSKNSLDLAVDKGLVHTTNFLLKAVQRNVNHDNIDGLINVLKGGAFLLGAVNPSWKETTSIILNSVKDINGSQLIEIVNSNRVEALTPMVSELCSKTEVGQQLKENIKSKVLEPIKNATGTVTDISSQNENFVTLIDELSENLPAVVDHVAMMLSHFKL